MGKKRVLSLVLALALVLTAGVLSVGKQEAEAYGASYRSLITIGPGESAPIEGYEFRWDNDETTASIAFSSNNESVATVSSDGVVSAITPGDAVITVTATGSNGTLNSFNVDVAIPPIVIKAENGYTIAGGDTHYWAGFCYADGLETYTVTAISGSDITWTIEDTNVAVIESSTAGMPASVTFKMIAIGETKLIATNANGESTFAYISVLEPTPADAAPVQEEPSAPSVGQSYTISPDGTIGSNVMSATGVLVAGDQKALPAGTVLAPTNAENTSASFTAAAAAVSRQLSNASVAKVIELNLSGPAGEIHQLDTYVTVTLPRPGGIPVGEGQVISVFRVDPNGKLTRCETTYNDYQIVFKTNHFSTFAFVVENASAAKAGGASTAPKTGEE